MITPQISRVYLQLCHLLCFERYGQFFLVRFPRFETLSDKNGLKENSQEFKGTPQLWDNNEKVFLNKANFLAKVAFGGGMPP